MSKKYQLRRIGLPPSIEEVKNNYSIDQDTTFIGRGKSVDIYLDSSVRKGLISRSHAHVIRTISEEEVVFKIYDTSLNGTYVNDVRIKNYAKLNENDKIAFGHLRGAIIEPGELAPQKETEFLFKFESGIKKEEVFIEIDDDDNTQEKSSVFMSPISLESDVSSVSLLGLHQMFDYEKSQIKEKLRFPKNVLSDFNKNKECDLKSVVSTITSKIYKDESSENDLNVDISPIKGLLKESQTLMHPNQRLVKFQENENNVSTCSSISTDTDIKRDTSLSLTHVYENIEQSDVVLSTLKSRINAVLNNKNCQQDITDVLSSKSSDCEIVMEVQNNEDLCFGNKDDDGESTFSDKSEEITDDADSSYRPSSPSDSQSSSPERRTRKAPCRFSPVLKNNKKIKSNPVPTKKNHRNSFTHDRCAAWDCIVPSGAIKQITWVACDDCDAWYHVTCSGLTAVMAKLSDTKYHCGCL